MNALHVRLVPDNPRLAPVPARSNRAVISTSMLHANDQIWHQMRTEPYGLTEHLVLLEFRIGPRSCVETAQGRETRQHAETRQHEERLTRLELWQTTDTTAGPSGRPGTTGLPSAVTDESMGVCRTILQPFVVDTRCPLQLAWTGAGCLRPLLAQTPRPDSGNSPSPREVCSAGQITDRAGPLRIYCRVATEKKYCRNAKTVEFSNTN